MNLTQNPFSVYDFLGYLIPGIFFTLGIYIIGLFPFEFQALSFDSISSYQNSIIIFITCYLIGHIISFISSKTIEKYSVWTLGFPSTYLFGKQKIGFLSSITSKYDKEHKLGSVARIIARLIMKFLISMIIFPITFWDIIIRHILRLHDQYARPLDADLLNIVESRMNSLIQYKYGQPISDQENNDKRDYFRIIYHHSITNATNHIPKIQNYVALYGFIRTTSFVFVCFFWTFFIKIVYLNTIKNYWWILFIISATTFILYLDFNKFYRKFSIEAIMAAITIKEKT